MGKSTGKGTEKGIGKSTEKSSLKRLKLQPLTPKEKGVLEFIESSFLQRGYIPSYQEIQAHFGWSSINSVQNFLKQLSRKKYIHWIPHQKRSIQILRSASSQDGPSKSESTLYKTPLLIPLLGDVAAGHPLERQRWDETFSLPLEWVQSKASGFRVSDLDKYFALKVQGDSMIEEGIVDGDVLVVRSQFTAANGDLVVARITKSLRAGLGISNEAIWEATVKRIYFPKTSNPFCSDQTCQIELRPSNSKYVSSWLLPDEVELVGLVKALFRKY